MAKALPKNQDVAEQLDLLADFLELEGAAKDLPGIGKTIEEKIVQIVDDGEIHALTKRKAVVPAEVVTFMRLPGLGPKSAAKIWKQLGIDTVDGLRAAAEAQQLRALPGFGARTEERILHALSQERTLEPVRPLPGQGLA